MAITEKELTTSVSSIEAQATDLQRMLSNTVLFTSKDDARPTLRCVRLVSDGSTLKAESTDSYTLGTDEVSATGQAFDVLIDRDDVTAWIKSLKAEIKRNRYVDPVVTLTVSHRQVTLTTPAQSISAVPIEAEFPNIKNLWPAEIGERAFVFPVDPARLAPFLKVDGESQYLTITLGKGDVHATGPVVIERGSFKGMAMPHRVS